MQNFTLKQLRYVEAAGRHSSIVKAANELNISQSSITAAINAIEARLGHDLFIRTPAKGIQCTPAGFDTLKLIRDFIHRSQQFEAEVLSMANEDAGMVRLACYATAAPAFLPSVLGNITTDYPNLSIRLLEGNMQTIIGFLNSGDADLAFTYSTSTGPTHDFVPLFEAPPYALLARGDPMAAQKSITLDELANRSMVLLDLPQTRDYFYGLFSSRDLTLNVAHSTRSAEIARTLVAAGFGFSILNIKPPEIEDKSRGYRAVPIIDPPLSPVFGIATNKDTRLPSIVRTFIQRCVDLGENGAFDSLVVRVP